MTPQEVRIMFKGLPATEQENFLRGLIEEHAYQRGIEGLPLPKEPDANASERANHAEGQAHRAERVLKKVAAHLQGELDRGYVLTHEPLAGSLWRKRHNDLLGEVEQVLGR
jgi:hypothetical protein